jgi:hypothetical protein
VEDAVLVAASSEILNVDILWQFDRKLDDLADGPWWGAANKSRLNMLFAPQVDSRDSYPIQALLQAEYVVIAFPFQHHLPIEEQDVVKVVADALLDKWEIGNDFARLPMTYTLENGVDVHIYERKRRTSLGTVVTTLKAMQARIGSTPGGQLDWVALNAVPDSFVSKNDNGRYTIDVYPSRHDASVERRFLYLNTSSSPRVVTGVIEHQTPGCEPLVLKFDTINDRGEITGTTSPALVPAGRSEFSLSFAAATPDDLLLTIISDSGVRYVSVTDLEVNAEGPGTAVSPRPDEPRRTSLGLQTRSVSPAVPTASTPSAGQLKLSAATTDASLDTVCGKVVNGPDEAPIEVPAGGTIQVEGWAVDKPAGGLARAVLIIVDEQFPVQAEYGQERADVAEALGNAAYLKSGYSANIPSELLPPGRHTLEVRVVSQDGRSYYPSAPTTKVILRVRD